jgi:hypothetical protein
VEDPRRTVLRLRWQGGACEDIIVQPKQPPGAGLRYPTNLVEQLRQMASSMHDGQIAAELNRWGMHSAIDSASSLPDCVCGAAGAEVKTNLLFFTEGKPTEKIWYYALSDVKVGKK